MIGVDSIFKDCEGCPNQGILKTTKGICRSCDKGIIKFGKRKCSERERAKITFEDMVYIDRRLNRLAKDSQQEAVTDSVGVDKVKNIFDKFISGFEKETWILIRTYKLKKLYQNWNIGIVEEELLEDCLSIVIENWKKILANGHYIKEVFNERPEVFSGLLHNLIIAKTHSQKMIAFDNMVATIHRVIRPSIAQLFFEGGQNTLSERHSEGIGTDYWRQKDINVNELNERVALGKKHKYRTFD